MKSDFVDVLKKAQELSDDVQKMVNSVIPQIASHDKKTASELRAVLGSLKAGNLDAAEFMANKIIKDNATSNIKDV